MTEFDPRTFRKGLIADQRAEPGLLSVALKLYRSDLVFRSLFDLTVAGIVVLTFSAGWSSLTSTVGSVADKLTHSATAAPERPYVSQTNAAVGQQIEASLKRVEIDLTAIEQSGSPAREKLIAIANAANSGRLGDAQALLGGLDDRDPIIAYVKAAVVIQQPGLGKSAEAQMLLRRATAQGVFPAYLLMGQVMFNMIVMDEAGLLPGSERVLVDDAGVSHPVNRTELATSADAWWQKAGGFNRPEGLRLAGFAKARGLSGKTDYIGASAYWKLAAGAGDALSQFELGSLLMYGTGVQSDVGEAIRLFRLAKRTIPAAGLNLSLARMPASFGGDVAAAEEGIQAAEESLQLFTGKPEEATVRYVLGSYLTYLPQSKFRDPSRGVDEFERSVKLGVVDSAANAADAYRTGVGKPKNLTCAYAFYDLLSKNTQRDVGAVMKEIADEIGENEVAKARNIASKLQPQVKGTADFAELKPHIKTETAAESIWRSACDAPL